MREREKESEKERKQEREGALRARREKGPREVESCKTNKWILFSTYNRHFVGA